MDSRSSRTDPGRPATSGADLTSAQFHILLTLSEGPRHGYGIMKEIADRTNGATELGPGTLYRSINKLLRAGLLVEVPSSCQEPDGGGSSRRIYDLTPAGKILAAQEARRLQDLVRWAREAALLEGGQT